MQIPCMGPSQNGKQKLYTKLAKHDRQEQHRTIQQGQGPHSHPIHARTM